MSGATDCIFLRLLSAEDKGTALLQAVSNLRAGQADARLIHEVDPAAFAQVPGSPFAYWVSDRIRRLFTELPPFEGEGRTVRVGLQTSDDFRFVRAWWEVPAERILDAANGPDWREDLPAFQAWCRQRTFEGKRWAAFAKGGEYSPYYADVHLVVNWEREGEEMKAWADPLYGWSGWSRIIKSTDYYFRPGLTWPLRGSRFSSQAVPAGCVFSVAGKMAFADGKDLPRFLVLFNSNAFDRLIAFFAGTASAVQYESGLIGKIPIPPIPDSVESTVYSALMNAILPSARSLISRWFRGGVCLPDGGAASPGPQEREGVPRDLLDAADQAIEDCYRIGEAWPLTVGEIDAAVSGDDVSPEASALDDRAAASPGSSALLLDFLLGTVYGRMSVLCARRPSEHDSREDLFSALPVCSPAMFQAADGLPAGSTPADYPIRVSWSGILVDDPGLDDDRPHPEDIVRRTREALEVLFPDRADEVEQEVCASLGCRSLRDYFRAPSGFFAGHLPRYSKSRRKAPIYWPLSTKSGSYTLWIYYHSLDGDLLFRAVNEFVNPKIREVEEALESRKTELDGAAGRAAGEVRRSLESLQDLRSELQEFRDELLRVANLPYRPNVDDGVLINAAPLWRLFRLPKWRGECEACWKELEAGAYEWAHLAYTIWPERVAEVCRGDRSIALAHGLEELYKGVRKAEGRTGRARVAEVAPSLPSLGGTPVSQARARGGAPSSPRSGSVAAAGSSGKQGPAPGDSSAVAGLSAAAEGILATLRAAPGPLGRAALVELTGIGEASWLSAIRQLKERSLVQQVGERRGAVYVAAGARPQANS